MLIESIIKRQGGTHVLLDDTDYHFIPDAEGRHVATVEDDDHIDTLLAITEGYRELTAEPKSDTPPATPPAIVPTEPVKKTAASRTKATKPTGA